ncbi:hypothetical protein [Rhizobium binae]|uniref:hypothetical protein n=1 Tax=Rhizobium binae TaxID=1138190 RepID=UPI003CCFE98A
MKLDFHFWLKFAIGRLRPNARKPANTPVNRVEEQDRSAGEYELRCWERDTRTLV